MSKPSGIMCPACDRAGNPDSELYLLQGNFSGGDGSRMLKCGAGHQFEYSKLMALQPRMRKLAITERQPPSTVLQQIWVHPAAWAALQQKFPSNLLTTIASLLAELASDHTLVIDSVAAQELHQLAAPKGIPVARGKDIVGLLRSYIELLKEIETLRIQQAALEPILKMFGVVGQGMAAGQNPLVAATAGAGLPSTELPPRSGQLPPIQHNEFGETYDEVNGNYVEAPDSLSGGGSGAARPAGFPIPR